MDDLNFDLSRPTPNVNLKISDTKTVTLSLIDIYEYAMIDGENGGTLAERIPAITKKFNDDHDLSLSAEKMYLIIFKGLEACEKLVGN